LNQIRKGSVCKKTNLHGFIWGIIANKI